jgi:GNAT superfamily N-acetyltransferase
MEGERIKNMGDEYQIVYIEHPEQSAWGIIGQGINEYNLLQAGDESAQRLCFVLQGPDQTIEGGVIGVIYWDWLYIDLMWLKEEFRGRGYGHRLLTEVEEEARRRGAKQAYLDTFSFQAPDFYKQHGYQVFGELNNFPAGHTRYFLTKAL